MCTASSEIACSSVSLIFTAIILIATATFSNAETALPPELVAKYKSMSSLERAEIAAQMGILKTKSSSPAMEVDKRDDDLPELDTEGLEAKQDHESNQDEESLEPRRFGLNLFDNRVSSFAPIDNVPVSGSYVVGAGDSFRVYMFGSFEADIEVTVARDGTMLVPPLGPVTVSGLNYDEVKNLLAAKVENQLVGTEVFLTLGRVRTINVFLTGEVKVPGTYSLSAYSTVMHALHAAGGISDLGSLREVRVLRDGALINVLDLYDFLLRGDKSGDTSLMSGDVIFVPPFESLVTLVGSVKRPGIYELSGSEDFTDALRMAGGTLSSAYEKKISIERKSKDLGASVRINLDLADIAVNAPILIDGDKIDIGSLKDVVLNEVVVSGAVARPRGYAWREGLRISDILGDASEDFLDGSDLSIGLLARRSGNGLEIEVRAIRLGEAMDNPGGARDLVLQKDDEIYVFLLPYLDQNYGQDKTSELGDAEFEVNETDSVTRSEELEEADTPEAQAENKQKGIRAGNRLVIASMLVDRLQSQAKDLSSTSTVEVTGEVRFPGKYPLLANGRLDELISLAGGFESSAFIEELEVVRTRLLPDGSAETRVLQISLDESVAQTNFKLLPLDSVRVKQIPNWSYGNSVELRGAVAFPGSYPIGQGELLSEVLDRAGGLSKNAFAQGAKFTKSAAKAREIEQIDALIASLQRDTIARRQTREEQIESLQGQAVVDYEDMARVLKKSARGRVVIDLEAILRGDDAADIELEDGDFLDVPESTRTVTVLGEVRVPGTFVYDQNLSVAEYIEKAAGVAARGDRKQIYIMRADGSVVFAAAKNSLLTFSSRQNEGVRVGDTIIVPVDADYQPVLAKYKEISGVIFQSVVSLYPLFRL